VLDLINSRPAAQRAEAFKTKYTFKTEMDADAKKFMFPQNERLNKA
jgi:GST-like protein